jgi:hypothetical protein
MDTGSFDEVLARFAKTGPEFGPGLSNHGPMAADALVAMGRGETVERWAEWYAPRLDGPPDARNPIAADGWREALGQVSRVGDWIAFFDRALASEPWRDALDRWVVRLAPGIMAGATHGFLRTAHAVRSLERGENARRIHELAEGLAYWAARYQELPGTPGTPGTMPVARALATVPLVPSDQPRGFLIFDAVKSVAAVDFAPVINRVDTTIDAGTFVSDVTRTFVRQYQANAATAAIAFVHTVTAPSALRIVAPHLRDETLRVAMACAWQACAAVYAAYGGAPAAPGPPEAERVETDLDGLVDEAVGARDEHAIKFTEACLREYAHSPDPAFVAAARDATARLRAG